MTHYSVNNGEDATNILTLVAYFYRNTLATLIYKRTHRIDECTEYKEVCEVSMECNKMLTYYTKVVQQDQRVSQVRVFMNNRSRCHIAFSSAMPVINKHDILDMIDNKVVIDKNKIRGMREYIHERDRRLEDLTRHHNVSIRPNELLTYFGAICLFETSIIRAYFIKHKIHPRIIFETEDAHLISLSCDGMRDQCEIFLDLQTGFETQVQQPSGYNEQFASEFAQWIVKGQPLEPILRWDTGQAPPTVSVSKPKQQEAEKEEEEEEKHVS